tara:strand:+ start:5821 stop:6036 length:216 start_codon:yes stop_codon:yes gene_type:complete
MRARPHLPAVCLDEWPADLVAITALAALEHVAHAGRLLVTGRAGAAHEIDKHAELTGIGRAAQPFDRPQAV